jgi:endonuclease YncB( thermonuclease family)
MSPDIVRPMARLLLALALAAASAWPTAAAADCPMPPKPPNLAPATVERVSDGDTCCASRMAGGSGRGSSASTPPSPVRTRSLSETPRGPRRIARRSRRSGGKPRRSPSGCCPRTPWSVWSRACKCGIRYGRLLAYLWLEDGSMVNVTIVREGYAQPFTKSPNVRYAALFRRCGQEARDAGRGLWRQP